MKILKNDWTLYVEAEEAGLVTSMGVVVEPIRTDKNNQLSDYFRSKLPKHDGTWGDQEGEEVLDALNEYMKARKVEKKASFPRGSGSEVYLVPVTDNLSLKLLTVDEYYGDGEYEKYIEIDQFIINDSTTEKDVDVLVTLMKELYAFS